MKYSELRQHMDEALAKTANPDDVEITCTFFLDDVWGGDWEPIEADPPFEVYDDDPDHVEMSMRFTTLEVLEARKREPDQEPGGES